MYPQSLLLTCLLVLTGSSLPAQVSTMAEAQSLAAQNQKPILIMFQREGCEYCELAAREESTQVSVMQALERVINLAVDLVDDEGVELAKRYSVGSYFPLFILTDRVGKPIARWAGYDSSTQFLQTFNRAMSDLTTIAAREDRLNSRPTLGDALFLAKYHSDAGDYIKSMNFYSRANSVSPDPRVDYGYQLFVAAVNASWNGQLPFDDVRPYADSVLSSNRTSSQEKVNLAKMMASLARKTGNTNSIEPYLKTAIGALGRPSSESMVADLMELKADYALHVDRDTAAALDLKKAALGVGWEQDAARYFNFADFCFQRRINLAEAEQFARRAAQLAQGDEFKASHLRLLSEICYARGKKAEAVNIGEQALQLDRTAAYFETRLNDMRVD